MRIIKVLIFQFPYCLEAKASQDRQVTLASLGEKKPLREFSAQVHSAWAVHGWESAWQLLALLVLVRILMLLRGNWTVSKPGCTKKREVSVVAVYGRASPCEVTNTSW